jgi:prefoldin subunit 5
VAESWERKPGETGPAYRAFCVYRDLGPSRTALLAYRQAKGKAEAIQLPGTWTAWSAENHWRERATAYDEHLEKAARLKTERDTVARRLAMLKRHQQAGELLTSRGVEFFVHQKIEGARDAIAAVGKGVDLERQAEGLPDWVIEVMNAPVEVLDERIADLEHRRRAALAGVPESTGDALSAAGSNGKH